MSYDVMPVRDPDTMHSIARQRYEIYVEELGYHQVHANAACRTVVEPLDATGVLYAVRDGEALAGSARVNYGCDDPGPVFGEYRQLYPMKRFGAAYPRQLCIVTKLMLAPSYRSGTLLSVVASGLYTHMRVLRPDVRFCLIDCVPPLRGVFERLGYRVIGSAFQHPAGPPVLPMAFVVYGRTHFERVGSPLARLCPHDDISGLTWFEQAFEQEIASGDGLLDHAMVAKSA